MQPRPQPQAVPTEVPAETAVQGTTDPAPPAPPKDSPFAMGPFTTPAPPAPPAPAETVLPSSDADYLQNPKPAYPAMSKRLGEQGRVVLRVLIGVDGLPQQTEIRQSSGFERLDQAAVATVMKWKFVPGKRNGVPEAMWHNVPFNWVLD